MNYFNEPDHLFLDSSELRNSKTYYYLRLCIHHDIPLIVHSNNYKRDLSMKAIKAESDPGRKYKILSATDTRDLLQIKSMMLKNEDMIIDSKTTFSQLMNYSALAELCVLKRRFLNDDEIRELILYDMSQGKGYIYE